MSSKLGVYWSVAHRRPQDYDYFRRLNPSVVKIMNGGPPDYAWVRANLPGALVIARDWALSEQHDDMRRDPTGTGKRHAQEWHAHADRLGIDRKRTLVLGLNEPRVWEPDMLAAVVPYTVAFCDECARLGLRAGALQLGVGWPANTGPDTPPNWRPYAPVADAIVRGNHALVCHEYWADQGPGENWGWWAGRTLRCPWDVPIVIGECGVDMYVKDPSVPHHSRGWQGRVSPERYAKELAEYVGRMGADRRFVGCCVFASDFANREWAPFDVQPAYQAILATPVPVPQPPPGGNGTVYMPVVSGGPSQPSGPTVIANTPAGANIRSGPGTGHAVLGAVPNTTALAAVGRTQDSSWWQVLSPWGMGWVSGTVVSARHTDGVPVTDAGATQSGDEWRRALAFVLRWEGGWADDPNDPGGATMRGITISTYTRWRQAHGQPAPSKGDLRNIPDAEVEQIYREWYWQASGADRMPWPLCLVQMDTAVNAGVGRAQEMRAKSGGDFLVYVAELLDWYTVISGWQHFGAAWTRRRADLLREAAK